ncbi:MAG: adenylate kinase [Clostridia bacterium]|nr:adenylate kinase [Clostridia bacterium]
MKKVIIIGCPGSGKSTFARALADKMGLPLYHLDMLYWNADRTTVGREEFRARLAEVMAGDEWIIDGNYISTMQWRMECCDTVFFLDMPLEVCLAGIEARKGKKRPDMPWVEQETDDEFIDFVRAFNVESRPRIMELLGEYNCKKIVAFKKYGEIAEFLGKI